MLDLCPKKPGTGKSRDYRDVIVFEKLRFQNVFSSRETKTGVFKFLRDLSAFEKWLCQISVHGKPNAAFEISPGQRGRRLILIMNFVITLSK